MFADLPPLTWIRAFEASARTLSFTDAAAELHLTQAAVSKHVKSLELRLNQKLFIRGTRSLELTKSGAAYLPKVQDALGRLASGTREVFGQRRSTALTLRCAVAFSVNWLAPRLPAFLTQHPRLDVRIVTTVWNNAFDTDAFDLDIVYGNGDWPGTISHRLTREALTPLCTPDLINSGQLSSPEDLRNHRLIHVLGYQDGWGVWLNAAGALSVDAGTGIKVDNSLTAMELTAQGLGVALGRTSLKESHCANGRLIAPFDLSVPIDEAFYLLQPMRGNPHEAVSAFVEWIKGEAEAAHVN